MTPFDRMEWLRLPLPTIPGSAAVVDTFELLTPAVLRELFAAANHPFSIALIPSDRFAARLTGREPLLTWAERVSLVQNFPISAICEVDS
ncbi:MAG: hypothetical protein N2689_18780, partial [Verrucomicrobiae bacterium]|nr:hypothetical protein [Verrucomicrobiae bacterium]